MTAIRQLCRASATTLALAGGQPTSLEAQRLLAPRPRRRSPAEMEAPRTRGHGTVPDRAGNMENLATVGCRA
ncbi:hypothetical protein K469DRAFT_305816 [Zopfia rhizophila CBS 207.26]|uniref:Uncharacterized protein n=1 Tax=Zopfia rhizophila CBS 207.26 TaxID=1314779 RepID=A0A6A6ELT1_9PEZI|nr:hypothetical protein K469DRAFT_305816 [Zopfia rhizophila CBS 207.26]